MKLNPDLIRDILLVVEEHCDFSHYIQIKKDNNNFEQLNDYTHEEILYHVQQCKLNNFVTDVQYYDNGDWIEISYLTPKGHEFLENIRNEDNWHKTKQYANKIGSFSLKALADIAVNVISTMIEKQFS